MHRVAPCQQDGLEMVPLGQVVSQCLGPDAQMHPGDRGAEAGQNPAEQRGSSPSHHSCCLVRNGERYQMENTGEFGRYGLERKKAKT